MNEHNIDDRPTKKRRFFEEPEPSEPEPEKNVASQLGQSAPLPLGDKSSLQHDDNRANSKFDSELLENFVGEKLPPEVTQRLHELAGENIEQGL